MRNLKYILTTCIFSTLAFAEPSTIEETRVKWAIELLRDFSRQYNSGLDNKDLSFKKLDEVINKEDLRFIKSMVSLYGIPSPENLSTQGTSLSFREEKEWKVDFKDIYTNTILVNGKKITLDIAWGTNSAKEIYSIAKKEIIRKVLSPANSNFSFLIKWMDLFLPLMHAKSGGASESSSQGAGSFLSGALNSMFGIEHAAGLIGSTVEGLGNCLSKVAGAICEKVAPYKAPTPISTH